MPRRATYVVQHYDSVDGEITPGVSVEFSSAQEAIVEAIRRAPRACGISVLELKVDTTTGVAVDGPYCLAQFGSVSEQFYGTAREHYCKAQALMPAYDDIH